MVGLTWGYSRLLATLSTPLPAGRTPPHSRAVSLPLGTSHRRVQAHLQRPPAVRAMGGRDKAEAERLRELVDTSAAMQKKVFPDVPEVNPLELYSALAPGQKTQQEQSDGSTGGSAGSPLQGKKLVVVDTRSDPECDVSMIPGGALRQSDFEARRDEFSGCAVVCYCTIGLRSGKYAAKLRAEHAVDAYNLRGSILAWTHERLPLTQSYSPQQGSAPFDTPSGEGRGEGGGGEGEREEAEERTGDAGEGHTNRVHVYSDMFALQADGYEPVTFPPSLGSRLVSLLPPWIIPKLGGWG